MIEDEIVHWWKGDDNGTHRTVLRIERENTSEEKGFPRDGIINVRIMNTNGHVAIKLTPDEALRLSTQLLAVAKELLNQKRKLWQMHQP